MFGFEFIILIVVAWLLLGPQQMSSLARFLGDTYRQVNDAAHTITRELDLEQARREAEEARAKHLAVVPPQETPPLPEAYRRYVEEFGEDPPNIIARQAPGPDQQDPHPK